MRSSEHEKLLADVLAEEGHGEFKAALHREALKEFRRCRKKRRLWLPLAIAASAAIGFVFWAAMNGTSTAPPQPIVADSGSAPQSAPQAPEPAWLLRTRPIGSPGSLAHFVQTTSSAVDVIVHSDANRQAGPGAADSLAIIQTPANVVVPYINDEGLLRLFGDYPVGFVFREDGQKEFFIVNR